MHCSRLVACIVRACCAYKARHHPQPGHVATPVPCHDTRTPRHAQAWSRHQIQVATPSKPNHVATLKSVSRHQLVLAYSDTNFWWQHQKGNTKKASLCRDTKNRVATLSCLSHVATLKSVSRPNLSSLAASVLRHQGPCHDTPTAALATT